MAGLDPASISSMIMSFERVEIDPQTFEKLSPLLDIVATGLNTSTVELKPETEPCFMKLPRSFNK
jgi:hypothetical protein